MSAKHVTGHVKAGMYLIALVIAVATMLLPPVATMAAIGIWFVLVVVAEGLLVGDRIWVEWLGFPRIISVMVKPRGFDASSKLTNGGSGGDGVICEACHSKFDEARDHLRSDGFNYCPDCSRVGDIVMNNYNDWFDTAADVREAE